MGSHDHHVHHLVQQLSLAGHLHFKIVGMEMLANLTINVAKMEYAKFWCMIVAGPLGMYTYKNSKHIFNLVVWTKKEM